MAKICYYDIILHIRQADTIGHFSKLLIDILTVFVHIPPSVSVNPIEHPPWQLKAEAEANRAISESLTDQIIENKKIEKWNGEMPKVTGSSGTFVDFAGIN